MSSPATAVGTPPSDAAGMGPGLESAAAVANSAQADAVSQALQEAQIVDHETREEGKRFTVYCIKLMIGDKEIQVFQRYSAFHELYKKLHQAFPKEKLKMPGKRLLGSNFDANFIQSRKKGLQEFVQQIVSSPAVRAHPAVRAFLLNLPRHGRGHRREFSNGGLNPEPEEDKEEKHHFDLEGEVAKANVKDFVMLRVIGKGSFGKVLLAKHKKDSLLFAVKVLTKEAIVKQNEVNHIMSERNVLLGNVKHPFLVGLHYSFQTPTKLYFVLDYVNGGELFFHLQREKKFSVARAQYYSAELSSALGFMHSLNIVYRDLKPENILFNSEGHVVLTDFGLCKENVAPGETTATFCGTPEYLAPEVLRKLPYGRAVDWWCLGCVTFEMMCGLPPYYSRDCNEMYDRILHDRLRFPDHVPPKARLFLEALLIRDPERRLGGGPADVKDIMGHTFFGGLDWAALDRKEIPPPWRPNVAGSLDLRNFDPDFVNEPVPQSLLPGADTTISVQVSDAFAGFSYDATSDLQRADTRSAE